MNLSFLLMMSVRRKELEGSMGRGGLIVVVVVIVHGLLFVFGRAVCTWYELPFRNKMSNYRIGASKVV